MKQKLLCVLFISVLFTKAHSQSSAREIADVPKLKGSIKAGKVYLDWSVSNNEHDERFEVEKSLNGKNFDMAGLVFTSEKSGIEDYAFYEKSNSNNKTYYRLKIVTKNNTAHYSDILPL